MNYQKMRIDFMQKRKTTAPFVYKTGEIDSDGIEAELVNIDVEGSPIGFIKLVSPNGAERESALRIENGFAYFDIPKNEEGLYTVELTILNKKNKTRSGNIAIEVINSLSYDSEEYETLLDTITQHDAEYTSNENIRIENEKTRIETFDEIKTDFENLTVGKQLDSEVIIARSGKVSLKDNIESKRDKSVLLTQSDLSTSSESHKLTMNHLSQEVKNAMTGTAPVSPNLSNEQVTTEKIANTAVNHYKTDFLKTTHNLYDQENATTGGFITATGNISTNASYEYSQLIHLERGVEYYRNSNVPQQCAFYDSNLTVVNTAETTNYRGEKFTLTSDSSIKYVRQSFTKGARNLFCKSSDLDKGYVKFGIALKSPIQDEVEKKSLDIETLKPFNLKSHNLIKSFEIEKGGYYTSANFSANANYYSTGLIEVAEGETYYTNNTNYSTYWAKDGSFIEPAPITNTKTIPTGKGIKFVRTTFANTVSKPMFCLESEKDLPYKPHRYELSDIEISTENLSTELLENFSNLSKLKGVNWCALGDSITVAAGAWNRLLAAETGANLTNLAQSGGTWAVDASKPNMDCNSRLQYIPENTQLVTIAYGTNDNTAQMGEIDSTDTATLNGAINVAADYIQTKFPEAVVVLATPILRHPEPTTLNERAEVIRKQCARHGFHCLDFWSGGGLINPKNAKHKELFITDGLHPNEAGNRLLMKKAKNFIESCL